MISGAWSCRHRPFEDGDLGLGFKPGEELEGREGGRFSSRIHFDGGGKSPGVRSGEAEAPLISWVTGHKLFSLLGPSPSICKRRGQLIKDCK